MTAFSHDINYIIVRNWEQLTTDSLLDCLEVSQNVDALNCKETSKRKVLLLHLLYFIFL